jgi:hypothetical protein
MGVILVEFGQYSRYFRVHLQCMWLHVAACACQYIERKHAMLLLLHCPYYWLCAKMLAPECVVQIMRWIHMVPSHFCSGMNLNIVSQNQRAIVALCAMFVALSLSVLACDLIIWYHMDLSHDWTLMVESSVWFLLFSCSIICTFLAVELQSSFLSELFMKSLVLQAVSDLGKKFCDTSSL